MSVLMIWLICLIAGLLGGVINHIIYKTNIIFGLIGGIIAAIIIIFKLA